MNKPHHATLTFGLMACLAAFTVLPMPIEDAPMHRVVIESNLPLKRAAAGNKSTVLKRQGQRVEVTVNDVHELVVLSY